MSGPAAPLIRCRGRRRATARPNGAGMPAPTAVPMAPSETAPIAAPIPVPVPAAIHVSHAPESPVSVQPISIQPSSVLSSDPTNHDVSSAAQTRPYELPTINGMRALRTVDVARIYPTLTAEALQRISDPVLPRVRFNRKNVMYLVEDLERFIAAHRSPCAVVNAGNG